MSLLPPDIHTTDRPAPCRGAGCQVMSLADPLASDPAVAGAKAASLARAHAVGLPVVPGIVLTTATVATLAAARLRGRAVLDAAWAQMGGGRGGPLVVRSSSTVEDQGASSMAGLFHSVLGVDTRAHFGEAVLDVIDSARSAIVAAVAGRGGAPMAVLVQHQVDAVISGVLFGADPVTGRHDRLVASVTRGTPDALVSGLVDGSQVTLDRRARIRATAGDDVPDELDRALRRRLVALAAATERAYGTVQDMEWALDRDGELWLLQSRPITTVGPAAPRRGTVWGPGPVAETFPSALRRLEADLWIEPLSQGLDHALRLTGAIPPRGRRRDGAMVRTVGGWVVADLDRLGANPVRPRSFVRKLDPRPPSWRLRAAWRVGRLGLAIGAIGRDVVLAADAALAEVPAPSTLDDVELVGTLLATRGSLVSLHAHEALAGMLVDDHTAATSSVVAAHRALAAGRAAGWSDDEIIEREPSVLALVEPHIPPRSELPATALLAPSSPPSDGALAPVPDADAAVVREALRLRIRWTHELLAHLALEAGRRLTARGALASADAVADVGLPELLDALRARRPSPIEVVALPVVAAPPDAFRLTADGIPAALPRPAGAGGAGAGIGAGGGRGGGPVWDLADGAPPPGSVLVTRFLEPGLAAHLPGLGGLVAETGSVLSHLAIVARELGVPTVVAAAGARTRFPVGTTVAVDGATGEVLVLDPTETTATTATGGA